jgi:FKBP-type peptidyl-prolyl cis-trans isomerase FkpA
MILNKRTMYFIILIDMIMILLASCNSREDLELQEALEIQTYLTNNPTLNFDLKGSGLYYLEVKTGTGLLAKTHDTAYIFYTAKFLDGTIANTNVGTVDTLIAVVNEGFFIKGFDEGLTYMREGGQSLLLTPSRLAYGPTGNYYNISGYTPLLYFVELIKVKPALGK